MHKIHTCAVVRTQTHHVHTHNTHMHTHRWLKEEASVAAGDRLGFMAAMVSAVEIEYGGGGGLLHPPCLQVT